MTTKAATYLAFRSVIKRSFTTLAPPLDRSLLHQASPSLRQPPRPNVVPNATKRLLPSELRFNSSSTPQNEQQESKEPKPKGPKRKSTRKHGGNASLRRVAVEAQRSRGILIRGKGKGRHVDPDLETKDVTAYCAAETYNVHVARDVLSRDGYTPDPFLTGMFPQVLHVRTKGQIGKSEEPGDVFVFPSGCVATWNVSEKLAHYLVERVLVPAAEGGHLDKLEAEDLEYLEDPTKEHSEIVGDTIILGTKVPQDQTHEPTHHQHNTADQTHGAPHEMDTTLAKIAFSSALARSTKLAVLENSLSHHLSTTRSIPSTLSRGSKPRFTRAFILRKTGELLHIRAQLNLYSELTDSLPDLFWDSPHELGLENYYEQVGRVLDVGIRIKQLNERMDYASEISAVLRDRLSEKHGHLLEWIIIWLILIEVAYGSLHLWIERRERVDADSTSNLLRAYLERELGKTG